MTLTLYNTLTRRKEPFRPIDPGNVRMYVCGPTVYDFAHIGNARPVIVFDVLFRLLRHMAAKGAWDGGKGETRVTYARNITDVDDKINARAAEEYPGLPLNEAIAEVTGKTTKQFHADIAALGVLPPTVEPRATEHIAEMRALCEALIAKGHAYVGDGHVLFDVSSMPDYGRLGNRSLEEMEAGARVDVAPYKKGPMDFVLWKPSKPGEPAWPAPAGINAPGRPGWHIECSAMADRWLWQEPMVKGLLSEAGLARPHVFDIHGGGIDLVFPHHENEIAQSRCGHGTPAMANVWMHNGFLQVEGEKMSKSLGNFVTINELLRDWPGEVLRLNMLRTHYRQPINWTLAQLRESATELWTWSLQISIKDGQRKAYQRAIGKQTAHPSQAMLAALSDDLNTPAAITELRALHKRAEQDDSAVSELMENCEFLGLLRHNRLGVHERGVSGTRPSGTGVGVMGKYHDDVRRLRISLANNNKAERERIVEAIQSDGLIVEIDSEYHVSLRLPEVEDQKFRSRIVSLVAARNAARKAKNFKEADRIRDELSDMGIQLKDAKDPATGEIVTTWEVKR